MSYDVDPSAPVVPVASSPVQTADSRDLETLVILLEMAALSLWTLESDTFTREALVNRAREYAGPGLVLRDIDLDLVIDSAGFLKKVRGGMQVR